MRGILLGLALAIAGCRRAPSSEETPISPALPVDATVGARARTVPRELAMLGGDLVDLGSMAFVQEFADGSTVLVSTLSDRTAYLLRRYLDIGQTELNAYDVATGARRWSHQLDGCWKLVATPRGAFCWHDQKVVFFDQASGASRVVRPAGVMSLTLLGSRVLVTTDERQLVALDEGGAPVGQTTLPTLPMDSYEDDSLTRVGGLVCGSGPDGTGTQVFCADASPRVV